MDEKLEKIQEDKKALDENLDELQKVVDVEAQERYEKQRKKIEAYNRIMRRAAYFMCAFSVLACLIGGICMLVFDMGVGAIVAGVIMLLLAPIIGGMLFSILYYEKHPEVLKDQIRKRADKMRAKQMKKAQKKQNKDKE